MKEKLIEIHELLDVLGFTDLRSVKKWCSKNKIPLLTVGKKTYTIANFLDLFLEKELELFVNANYKNPEAILAAINNDDKAYLSDLLNAPATEKVKKKYTKSQKMSKQAEDFLKQLKQA